MMFARYEVDVPALKEASELEFLVLSITVHSWILENCRDKFTWVSHHRWAFVDPQDAALFKLRWG